MAISAVCVYINARFFEKVRTDPSLLSRAIMIGCLVTVLCIVYFALKSYPMDYAGGVLVVNPSDMKEDGYAVAGAALGILTGAFLEVRYVRTVLGFSFIAAFMLLSRKHVYSLIGRPAGHVVIYAVAGLYIIFLYPALFTAVRKRFAKSSDS